MASSIFGRKTAAVGGLGKLKQMLASTNPFELIRKFAAFKRAIKNPEQLLNKLRSDGTMSDAQFAELKETAESLITILR